MSVKRKLKAKSEVSRKKPKNKAVKLREVSAKDLQWKTVDVSAHLDDYEGFYGLEEIDGVDIEIDNGIVKFKQLEEESVESEDAGSDAENEKLEDTEKSPKPEKSSRAEKSAKPSEPEKSEKSKKAKKIKGKREDKEELTEELDNPFELLDEDVDTSVLEWGGELSSQLSLSILKALTRQKFIHPTEIQKLSIPAILSGRDVIGKAATGSGKTLAYGIPIIERHLQLTAENTKPKDHPTGLILAPTRELVHQISKHLDNMWRFCRLETGDSDTTGNPSAASGVVSITGGLAVQKQLRLLDATPAIVVATPGRFLDILSQNEEKIVDMFSKCETLVLDEADRLIQQGHFQELDKILDLIGRGRRSGRQTLVFSATFEMDLMNKLNTKRTLNKPKASSKDIIDILDSKLEFKDKKKKDRKSKNDANTTTGPLFLDTNPAEAVASQVVESILECGAMEKDLNLYYFLLAHPGRTIVFVNSIDSVKRLTPFLKELGLACFGLHSDMIQKQRLRSLEKFKENDQAILVSTDVAARGLDIPLVQHVIHYHLPRSADMYVHRSGRTARAGNEGVSLIICSPEEASGPLIKLKSVLYKKSKAAPKALKTFEVDYDLSKRLKARASLAKKISDMTQEATKKGKTDAWLQQAAEDLGVDFSDEEEENDSKSNKNAKLRGIELKQLRAQLKSELERPVGYGGRYLTRGTVNLAQMMTSNNSHAHFVGKKQQSALQALQ